MTLPDIPIRGRDATPALNLCPCCKQPVKARQSIVVSIDANSLSFRDQIIYLTPQLAEIASVLAERAPLPVSRSFIVERVWGMKEREPTAKNLDVQVLNLRRRISAIGLRIDAIRGRGFRMSDDDAPAWEKS